MRAFLISSPYTGQEVSVSVFCLIWGYAPHLLPWGTLVTHALLAASGVK